MAHDPRPLRAPPSTQLAGAIKRLGVRPRTPGQARTTCDVSKPPEPRAAHGRDSQKPSGRFREGMPATVAGMHIDTTNPTARGVDPDELDRHIAEMYRDVANEAGRDLHFPTGRPLAEALGYPTELLGRLPAEAVNSFAGVGYHLGLAHLLPGERVLDLGSGSGMDVFAAAAQVGPRGLVTGVDITPEQLAKSERLRRDEHVSFRSRADRGAALRGRLVRRRDLQRRGQSLGRQAPRVRRGGARTSARRTARARRHRDRAARSLLALRAKPTSGPPASPGPAREISTWRTSRPPAWSCTSIQANPDYRFTSERAQRTSRQVRRSQRLDARAQAATCIPPRLPTGFG